MPNFKRIGGGAWKNGQKSVDLTWNDPYAALELVDRIITQMDKKGTPINIFLDLSKAFDTIDHTILLAKLRYYGIHDTALLLLKSYLNNRKQYVEFEDTKAVFTRATFGLFVARHRDWRRRPTPKPLSRRLSAEVEHVPMLGKK